MSDTTRWEEGVREFRDRKDRYLADDPHSPLPPELQDSFEGLDYYPIDPAYRFELELHEHADPETVTVHTTTEGERDYLDWGEFRFELGGAERTLQAFRRDPADPALWLPFRDETNGEETYGAGRYLDLEPEEDRTADGLWVVDFNLAYNPFCAYSVHYECPLVPMENWLAVRVEAGERTFEPPA